MVGWLPLYHDMGLIGNVLQPLYAGGAVRADVAGGLPAAPAALAGGDQPLPRRRPAAARTSPTTCACARSTPGGAGGARPVELAGGLQRRRAGARRDAGALRRGVRARAASGREAFYPCYGLAEATLFVAGGAPGEPPVRGRSTPRRWSSDRRSRAGSRRARALVGCGQRLAGQRVAIVDPETGEPLRRRARWARSGSRARASPRGYWNRPEETARDLRRPPGADGDGPFLRTGDLGFLAGGELFVTGRLKDLIILRGRNHYPQDVELTAEREPPGSAPGCGAAFAVERRRRGAAGGRARGRAAAPRGGLEAIADGGAAGGGRGARGAGRTRWC